MMHGDDLNLHFVMQATFIDFLNYFTFFRVLNSVNFK